MNALALTVALLASSAAAQPAGTVLAALTDAVRADAGFAAAERDALSQALAGRFADYGLQTNTGARKDAVQVALSMIVEGSFDEAAPERVAEVAFSAYQAVARGAPAEVVQGIGLYGYRKRVPAETLSAWANGYRQMTDNKVAPEVAADLVRAAMEGGWEVSTFDTLKWSLVESAKRKFDQKDYATYLLGHMQTPGTRPGALTAKAQEYFKKIAKTGQKPELPAYEGVFTPKTAKSAPSQPVNNGNDKGLASADAPSAPPGPKAQERSVPKASAPVPAGFSALWPALYSTARSYLGTPYVWGGVTRKGVDCSGLTQNTYGENEISIPRVSKDQWQTGSQVPEAKWREGDLVFFNTLGHGVSHVGMVVDTNGPKFIHASSSKGVMVADLSKNYFRTRYLGARRVVP